MRDQPDSSKQLDKIKEIKDEKTRGPRQETTEKNERHEIKYKQ